MNERVRELAEQSKPIDENGQKVRGLNSEYHNQWMKKFAELIIRDCIEQAHSVGDLRGANDDMIYGADYAAVQITKYFGVEE